MDAMLSICIGIGLSAACGFRVFMPSAQYAPSHQPAQLPPPVLLCRFPVLLTPRPQLQDHLLLLNIKFLPKYSSYR